MPIILAIKITIEIIIIIGKFLLIDLEILFLLIPKSLLLVPLILNIKYRIKPMIVKI